MCVSVRQRFRQYVALLTCLLLLLSVVIPHHHHSDGTPCCQSIEWEHSQGDQSADSHQCGCEGHNLAVFDQRDSHQIDNLHLHLISLETLFDYVYPPEIAFWESLLDYEDANFSESLYKVWLFNAIGLRAPPVA